jgi:hypothetical protein
MGLRNGEEIYHQPSPIPKSYSFSGIAQLMTAVSTDQQVDTGNLLKQGSELPHSRGASVAPTLAEVGITKSMSSRAQKIAGVS